MSNSLNYLMRKNYIELLGLSISSGPGMSMTLNDAMKAYFENPTGGGGTGVDLGTATGFLDADKITAGATNSPMTTVEKSKLAGIATGATANSSDATLLARGNHTGTESADVITDGTINKAFLATERTKLTGVATGATANSSDATLLARGNHTGTESADVLTDGTTNKAFLATERTKLTGVATSATANSSDATLLARTNHTGVQAISTVTSLQSNIDALTAGLDTLDDKKIVFVNWITGGTGWGTYDTDATHVRYFSSTNDLAATAPTKYNEHDKWFKVE